MRTTSARIAAGAASLVLALTACASGDNVSEPAPAASSSQPATSSEPSATATSSQAAGSSKPSATAVEPGAGGALDLRQRHPNGTVLRVLGISATATTTTVQIEAVNGFTREIELNVRGIHLADDLGNGYNFVDPDQNAKLAVPPGGTLTGTLTFLGQIEPKATKLRLLINTFGPDETVDINAEFDKARSPAFQIDDIPVPET